MNDVKITKPGAVTRRYETMFPTFPFGGGLFNTSPFNFMRRMTEEMDRACARFIPGVAEPEFWAPVLEVTEKEGNFIATLELPGLKKEEVKVEVIEEGLAISGERKMEKEEKEEDYFRSERRYGSFYRIVPLPKGAKVDNVKAELHNGVLTVTIPVPEVKANVKQIPVTEVKK
jgi:HSP20 family protein